MHFYMKKKIGDCGFGRGVCRTVTLQQQKRQTYSEPRTERVE